MNDMQFMFCDQVIVFDHFKQQIQIIGNVHIPQTPTDAAIEEAYARATAKIDATIERLQQPIAIPVTTGASTGIDPELGDIQSNLTKEQFIANVEKSKEYIRAGDIFQVVLSQRFNIETDIDPLHVYRVLRTMNPSPIYVLFENGGRGHRWYFS